MRQQHTNVTNIQPPRQPQQSPLSTLPQGVEAVVVHVLENPDRQRCAELGFIPGAHVKVMIPGDPMAISLNGSRMAISQRMLANVIVSYCP